MKNKKEIVTTPKYQGAERRKYLRFDYPFFVRCKKNGKTYERGGPPIITFAEIKKGQVSISKNVSIAGIHFVTGKSFIPGDLLFVEIFSPTRKTPFKILGKVIWKKRRIFPGEYDLGIQFLKIDAGREFQKLLEELEKVKLEKKLD